MRSYLDRVRDKLDAVLHRARHDADAADDLRRDPEEALGPEGHRPGDTNARPSQICDPLTCIVTWCRFYTST